MKRQEHIENLLADDSFIRWINGEAAPEEEQHWERWLMQDPARSQKVREAVQLRRELKFKEELPDTIADLNKLRNAVNRYESIKQPNPGRHNYWVTAAVAAILLVASLVLIRFGNWDMVHDEAPVELVFQDVKTGNGQLQRITFPDGSSVLLNANSLLRYPESFSGNQITFKLEGEAYFSLVNDSEKTGSGRVFTVQTPEGEVTVLGTRFNVHARENQTEIVLEQGKVQVASLFDAGTGVSSQTYVMTPGQRSKIHASSDEIEVDAVQADLFTAWTNLELRFRDTPLNEITKRIEQTYGVEVVIKDESLRNTRFSGTAPNENLSVLLEGLRTLLNVPIMEEPNLITIG